MVLGPSFQLSLVSYDGKFYATYEHSDAADADNDNDAMYLRNLLILFHNVLGNLRIKLVYFVFRVHSFSLLFIRVVYFL